MSNDGWMADGRVMEMLPKWRRAYTQGWDKRPEWVDAPGGQKITVTKYSAGRKKLWRVSHKIRFFRVSKVFWPTPVLPKWWKCCVLLRSRQPFQHPMAYGIGNTTRMNGRHWWRWYSTIIIFLILNRIFLAEKCLFRCFRSIQPGLLWIIPEF